MDDPTAWRMVGSKAVQTDVRMVWRAVDARAGGKVDPSAETKVALMDKWKAASLVAPSVVPSAGW
jgi:hypothetical protein